MTILCYSYSGNNNVSDVMQFSFNFVDKVFKQLFSRLKLEDKKFKESDPRV